MFYGGGLGVGPDMSMQQVGTPPPPLSPIPNNSWWSLVCLLFFCTSFSGSLSFFVAVLSHCPGRDARVLIE